MKPINGKVVREIKYKGNWYTVKRIAINHLSNRFYVIDTEWGENIQVHTRYITEYIYA